MTSDRHFAYSRGKNKLCLFREKRMFVISMKLMIWLIVLTLSFLLLEVTQTSKQQGKEFPLVFNLFYFSFRTQ